MNYFLRHKLAFLATLALLVLTVTIIQPAQASWVRFGGGVDGTSEKLWALNVFAVCRDGIVIGVASTTPSGEVTTSAVDYDTFTTILNSTELTVSEKPTPIVLSVPVPGEDPVDRDFFYYDYYTLPWLNPYGNPFDIETRIQLEVLAVPVGGQQLDFDVSDCTMPEGYSLVNEWGVQFAGFGEFNSPSSVTVDADGNFYVAENGRIQKFNSNAVFLSQFRPDSGDDISIQLSDMTIDDDGNIYILDKLSFRIVKFDNDGNYLTQWGGERGISALDEPLMDTPNGIAVDADGNVYVTDGPGVDRVIKYSTNGVFIESYDIDIPGVMFENLGDIALDSSGNIYLIDTIAEVVAKYTGQGVYITQWGTSGAGNGQFDDIARITIDTNNNVYVLDWGNNRIQRFNVNGVYQSQWMVTNDGSFETPGDIGAGPQNAVYTTDYSDSLVRKYNGISGMLLVTKGEFGIGDGQFGEPTGIAMSSDETVYVVDTANHRVQYFDKIGNYLGQWGTSGSGDGQFNFPVGIAIAPNDTIYITDSQNSRIQYFDLIGNYLGQWGEAGMNNGEFNYPAAIALDSTGNVYVADAGNNRIQKFTTTGEYLLQWGSFGFMDGEFSFPAGIGVNAQDVVYVVNTGNQNIQTFSTEGVFIDSFGSFGTGRGQFSQPYDIAFDVFGNIFIADSENQRVQKFDSDWNYLTGWRMANLNNNKDEKPYGLVLDALGNVYVTDQVTKRVHVYTNFQAPLLDDDAYMVLENGTLTVDAMLGVLVNDQPGIMDSVITASIYTQPNNGTLTLDPDGAFIYTPAADYAGVDSFTYIATNAAGTQSLNTGTVTINVLNPPPIAVNNSYETLINTALTVSVTEGVLSNDTDENGDTLTAQLVTDVMHGSLTLNADGSFSYTPSINYVGVDSFTYVANDGSSNSNEATVSITVNSVPPTPPPDPVLDGLTVTLPSEGNAYPTFTWSVTDPPSDWYEIRITLDSPGGMMLIYAEWIPAPQICTTETCTFTVDSSILPFGLGEGTFLVQINGWTWTNEAALEGIFEEGIAGGMFTIDGLQIVNANTGRPILTFQDDPNVTWVNVYIGTPDFITTFDFTWYEKATAADCDGSVCVLIPDGLPLFNGTFDVWLQSWDGSALSNWSGPFPFSLNFAPAPLIAPLTTTVTAGNPTFQWMGNNGTTWYHLWVGTAAPEYATQHQQWYQATDMNCNGGGICTITPAGLMLETGTAYSWWVQAWSTGGITTEGEAGWQEGGNFTP